MSMRNDPLSTSVSETEYLEGEISEAVAIYELLYPTEKITFVFYQGADPVWSAPNITEGRFTFRPDHLNADFLGTRQRAGAYEGAPEVTIALSIPRRPNPNELKRTDAPWRPIRPLGRLFAMSPMGYEKIRYAAEMRRKKRSEQKMPVGSMMRGDGAGILAKPQKPDSDKGPAILIGMHWLEVGGAEKLGFDTIEWALKAGLRVFVVASVPAIQRLAHKLPDSGDVTFIRLDRFLPHDRWPRYVANLIAKENVSLVHIHHCIPLYESLPQIRAMTPWVKVIDSTHIVEYADGGYPRSSGVWSEFIDVHHVISKELVDYYRDRFQTIGKLRLGRMLDRADSEVKLPQINLVPGQKKLRVTFVGRLYYQKRPIVVVAAFRALSDWAAQNGVELVGKIVGEGPFEDAARKLLQAYGLANAVEMHPANSPVPAILHDSDVLLLPSNNEGLALVCYEAIEQGCIPISTNVGSQGEIVPEDLLIPLAPSAAVKGIVETVDRLWKDRDFAVRQQDALAAAWTKISNDATAQEALMPIYREAASANQE